MIFSTAILKVINISDDAWPSESPEKKKKVGPGGRWRTYNRLSFPFFLSIEKDMELHFDDAYSIILLPRCQKEDGR